MENNDSNRALIEVQINTLERSKERHSLRCVYAGIYGLIMVVLFIAVLGSEEPLAICFVFIIIFAIITFFYHTQKIKEIDNDIEKLKKSIQKKDEMQNEKPNENIEWE